jgi:hypothetical protein
MRDRTAHQRAIQSSRQSSATHGINMRRRAAASGAHQQENAGRGSLGTATVPVPARRASISKSMVGSA